MKKALRLRGFVWLGNTITNVIALTIIAMLLCNVFCNTAKASDYTLSMTSSGVETIDIIGGKKNAIISLDEITVYTTCPSGYNFTISTSVDDNNLYLDGDSTNNDAGKYFAPADGHTALSASANTWGYYYTESDMPTLNTVFQPIPTFENAAVIKSPLDTISYNDISDSFNIYYGVSITSNLASGIYKMIPDNNNEGDDGTIVYSATIAESCLTYTVQFDPASTAAWNQVSGTGTMSNQIIYEDIGTPLASNEFTPPSGYEFLNWNTEQDGSGISYDDEQEVINLAEVGETITLYAQWAQVCPAGGICYDANDEYAIGAMGEQEVSDIATEIILLAPNYYNSGYGFAGWSDDRNAANHLDTATIYGPNETITFDAGDYESNGRRLYAVWIPSEEPLQNWECPDDDTMPIGSVTALYDERDDNTYAIAKLADGKCWMIENLRLEYDNSDNEDGLLAQGYALGNGYEGQFSGLAGPEEYWNTAYGVYDPDPNSLYSTDGSDNTINIGTTKYPELRFPRYNNDNTSNYGNAVTDHNQPAYGYGNYYTWAAAIADTSAHSAIVAAAEGGAWTGRTVATVEGTSICPSGWRLPGGGNKEYESNNEYWELIVNGINGGVLPANYDNSSSPHYDDSEDYLEGTEVSEAIRAYPNNFVYSGEQARGPGHIGGYWTFSLSNTNSENAYSDVHALLFSTNQDMTLNDVAPGTGFTYKNEGLSIRCVADTQQ